MISLVIVVIDKVSNMSLQFFRAVVMLKFNNVLYCPVVSLYFSLVLGMKWLSVNRDFFIVFKMLKLEYSSNFNGTKNREAYTYTSPI